MPLWLQNWIGSWVVWEVDKHAVSQSVSQEGGREDGTFTRSSPSPHSICISLFISLAIPSCHTISMVMAFSPSRSCRAPPCVQLLLMMFLQLEPCLDIFICFDIDIVCQQAGIVVFPSGPNAPSPLQVKGKFSVESLCQLRGAPPRPPCVGGTNWA